MLELDGGFLLLVVSWRRSQTCRQDPTMLSDSSRGLSAVPAGGIGSNKLGGLPGSQGYQRTWVTMVTEGWCGGEGSGFDPGLGWRPENP